MSFDHLTFDELQAELESRLAKHHEPMYAYAAKLAEQESEK